MMEHPVSIRESLRHFLLENYLFTDDPSKLNDSDSFLDNGILDSTGILDVILFVEENHHVKVSEDEMVPDNLDSIDALVTFIEKKQAVNCEL